MFTRAELEAMTIRQLRLVDINTREEEEMMQEVLNIKLGNIPATGQIKTSDVPDIKTPKEEAEWQEKLDQRKEELRNRNIANGSEKDNVLPGQTVLPIPEVESETKDEVIDHVVTQEDLDLNPELVEEGVKAGDTIQLPKPSETVPVEEVELERLNKTELIAHAKKAGITLEEGLTKKQIIEKIRTVIE